MGALSLLFFLLLFLHLCGCSLMSPLIPEISPIEAPSGQPFLPLPSPSPLSPFTNTTAPKLSGQCSLNFTAAKSLIRTTSVDCYSVFAPYLANVICCPQLQATLTILVGQNSKSTNLLALSPTEAQFCLSDIEQTLSSQGAADNLNDICSVGPLNLTEASCPVKSVAEFENTVDLSKLIRYCERIDPVKECCEASCQNAILEASTRMALRALEDRNVRLVGEGVMAVADHSSRIDDCKRVVVRWLASRLDMVRAKDVLRGLSNCDINKACPLIFPDPSLVAKSCQAGITNETACCESMESYVSHLQKQSFITNLQALDCASLLGMKLRRLNVTKDVYSLCRISLKDFSLQANGNQDSGCLLPSLPSDATFDKSSGISFLCDLNDNIPALWPLSLQLPASSCNKTIKIPALPAATSAQTCLRVEGLNLFLISAFVAILLTVLSTTLPS